MVDYHESFKNRETMPMITLEKDLYTEAKHLDIDSQQLKAATYEQARLVAPVWDVYELEKEWRSWITEPPRNPDAAFIGFCRKWYEKSSAA